MDYRSASPETSDVFSEEMDTDSLKENSLLNRTVAKYNNNNFKVGYMPVEDTKPGMRGRKTIAFWTLLVLLFILVIGNLILTVTIIGVLKLGQGMQNIELVPNAQSIKLFGDVNLDHIYKRDGKIEGYKNQPMEITSNDSPILLSLVKYSRGVTKVKVDPNEILFKSTNSFEVKDKEKETIFTVTNPIYKELTNANSLNSKYLHTNKIRSPTDSDLHIEGDIVTLKGAEGSNVSGKEVFWSADQDIYLKSINGSIILMSQEGIFVDLDRIPIAKLNHNYVTSQFKVCVCMPEGKLFRLPVANPNQRVFCDYVNMAPQYNPCI
ncbi:sarcoglycan beta [Leptinotarsa decemlineata]|uniref:sarcoglycan beta n=1 Tax=Leptinotarsa decemlineata TaxID=7539 RepID=UPI000C252DD5|nr:beta-sarcoglycan [Leptinotarsa decemlineata]